MISTNMSAKNLWIWIGNWWPFLIAMIQGLDVFEFIAWLFCFRAMPMVRNSNEAIDDVCFVLLLYVQKVWKKSETGKITIEYNVGEHHADW